MTDQPSPPSRRRGLHGVGALLTGALVVVLLAGGAFAIGRTTAPTSKPPAAHYSTTQGPGMMPWLRGHHDDIAWMRQHMGEVAWLRGHPREWLWIRQHSGVGRSMMGYPDGSRQMMGHRADWHWMRAHWADIAWMHNHWRQWMHWRASTATARGVR